MRNQKGRALYARASTSGRSFALFHEKKECDEKAKRDEVLRMGDAGVKAVMEFYKLEAPESSLINSS